MDKSLPAFPHSVPAGNGHPQIDYPGMTLRDYFAAQFVARAQSLSTDRDGGWDYENVAQCAYAMADAMLAERAK